MKQASATSASNTPDFGCTLLCWVCVGVCGHVWCNFAVLCLVCLWWYFVINVTLDCHAARKPVKEVETICNSAAEYFKRWSHLCLRPKSCNNCLDEEKLKKRRFQKSMHFSLEAQELQQLPEGKSLTSVHTLWKHCLVSKPRGLVICVLRSWDQQVLNWHKLLQQVPQIHWTSDVLCYAGCV